MATPEPPLCESCGHPRTERTNRPGTFAGAHGWCGNCTDRWYRAGRPTEGPPSPQAHADRTARSSLTLRQARLRRLGEYLRSRESGLPLAAAAERAGIAAVTAMHTYEPHYWRQLSEEKAA